MISTKLINYLYLFSLLVGFYFVLGKTYYPSLLKGKDRLASIFSFLLGSLILGGSLYVFGIVVTLFKIGLFFLVSKAIESFLAFFGLDDNELLIFLSTRGLVFLGAPENINFEDVSDVFKPNEGQITLMDSDASIDSDVSLSTPPEIDHQVEKLEPNMKLHSEREMKLAESSRVSGQFLYLQDRVKCKTPSRNFLDNPEFGFSSNVYQQLTAEEKSKLRRYKRIHAKHFKYGQSIMEKIFLRDPDLFRIARGKTHNPNFPLTPYDILRYMRNHGGDQN